MPDALGSVRQVMTSENLITLAQSFDPFGNLRERQGNSATAYGYASEWADASGLINLRARYYDPAQGRFLTRDPFPGVLPQPATLQPYQYVVNNPVLLTDPSGEIAPLLIIAGIGFAAGAISNAYQQTNGFTDFCRYDILETLAWGVGGAAAASTFAIMSITGVGFLGMGIQGAAIGLSSLGISASSSIFLAGSAAVGLSNATMTRLFTSTSSIANINQTLSTAASHAQQTVGPGRGAVYGTRVHTAFSQEVSTLRQSNLKSEVSYLSGQIVQYGTSGSVRIDVVYGPIDNPIAVFDLKTGSAALTTSRIEQIQSNLPRPNIPIFEVRP